MKANYDENDILSIESDLFSPITELAFNEDLEDHWTYSGNYSINIVEIDDEYQVYCYLGQDYDTVIEQCILTYNNE